MEWISSPMVIFRLGWSGEIAEVGGWIHCNSLWMKWYEIGLEGIKRKEEIDVQKPFNKCYGYSEHNLHCTEKLADCLNYFKKVWMDENKRPSLSIRMLPYSTVLV